MEVERKEVYQDPATGTTEVVRTESHIPSRDAVEARQANKAAAIVWYIVSIIEVLLLIRLILLLTGARTTGFTAFIYDITRPFVAPFQGIFPSPDSDLGFFDTATLVAMIIYALIGWAIVSLIEISRRDKVAA